MAHNTDKLLKTESMQDRAEESLKYKESYDVCSPIEQVVREMETMQSEYDNRPWDTLFHGNHRFKE